MRTINSQKDVYILKSSLKKEVEENKGFYQPSKIDWL
jgi:hypothetical protein